MKILKVIILGIFVLPTFLYSQSGEFTKGYIVTSKGVKKDGLIRDDFRDVIAKRLSFKVNQSSSVEILSTEDVEEFFIEPSFYFSRVEYSIDGRSTQLFLRKLVDGKSKLYEYSQGNKISYIITKESGESLQISRDNEKSQDNRIDNKYIGQLKSFFKDCNDFAHVKTIKWSKKDLSNRVIKYNDCIYPNTTSTYLGQGRRLQFKPGLMAGIRMINVNISDLQPPKRAYDQNINTYQVGVVLSIQRQRRLAAQIGILYSQYKTDVVQEFSLTNILINHQLGTIEIPILFKYNLSGKKLTPYVFIGGRTGVFLGGESSEIEEFNGAQSAPKIHSLQYNRMFGLDIGLGLSLRLPNQHEGAIEINYNRLGIILEADEDVVTKGFSLNTKIFF